MAWVLNTFSVSSAQTEHMASSSRMTLIMVSTEQTTAPHAQLPSSVLLEELPEIVLQDTFAYRMLTNTRPTSQMTMVMKKMLIHAL